MSTSLGWRLIAHRPARLRQPGFGGDCWQLSRGEVSFLPLQSGGDFQWLKMPVFNADDIGFTDDLTILWVSSMYQITRYLLGYVKWVDEDTGH